MTDPKQPQAWNLDPVGNTRITPEQARRAALTVAAAYPDNPLIARHLLDVLGLLDLSRPRCDGTSAHVPAPVDATEPARPPGAGLEELVEVVTEALDRLDVERTAHSDATVAGFDERRTDECGPRQRQARLATAPPGRSGRRGPRSRRGVGSAPAGRARSAGCRSTRVPGSRSWTPPRTVVTSAALVSTGSSTAARASATRVMLSSTSPATTSAAASSTPGPGRPATSSPGCSPAGSA
jgi:hypothetical protein